MKRVFATLATAALFCVTSAHAYNIKHSYSAAGNATEYHGSCANGATMMVVDRSDGSFYYEGPAGEGTIQAGSLDKAAQIACGE